MMKEANISVACILGVVVLVTSGCAAFRSPMENPIIEDHSRGLTTFGTIPSRRMVILKPRREHDPENIFVCAEPSPDVSDNIASSLAAAVSGEGLPVGGSSAAKLAASLSKSLATTARHLFKRTQGLQLYRDAMYNLCQAKMNGVIDDTCFNTRAKELFTEAIALIKDELKYLPVSKAEDAVESVAAAESAAKQAAAQAATSAEQAKQAADCAEATPKK